MSFIWAWQLKKTPSYVRISKGNFLIRPSEVLSVFYKLISSSFIGLVKSFNPKNKKSFKGSDTNSKNEYWIYSK